jgi:hypothetical protein
VRLHYEPPVNNNGGGCYGPQGHNPPEDHKHYGPQVNQRVPGAVATAAVVDDTAADQKWRKEHLFLSRPKVHLVFPKHTVVPVAAAASVAISTTVDQEPKEPIDPMCLETGRGLLALLEKTDIILSLEVPENLKSLNRIWAMSLEWLEKQRSTFNTSSRSQTRLNGMIGLIEARLRLLNPDEVPCDGCGECFKVERMVEAKNTDRVGRLTCLGCH